MTATERKRRHTPHQPVGRWIRADKRLAIYLRDGFTCGGCLRSLAGAPAHEVTLDHIRPRCRGGTNNATNLYTCCARCNSSRGSRTLAAAFGAHLAHTIRTVARRQLAPYLAQARSLAPRTEP